MLFCTETMVLAGVTECRIRTRLFAIFPNKTRTTSYNALFKIFTKGVITGNWIRLIITWIAEYLNQFYIRTHKRVVLSNIYPAQHFDLYKKYEVKIMVGWTDQEVLYCNLSNVYSVLTSAFSKTNVKVIPTQSVLEDAWVQLIVNVCFIFV